MIDEMVEFLRDEYKIDVMEKRRLGIGCRAAGGIVQRVSRILFRVHAGQYFGKNHATILHHFKNHDALMLVPQYREVYASLTEILTKYDERAKANKEQNTALIEILRKENEC
jgi:hypothetical protein